MPFRLSRRDLLAGLSGSLLAAGAETPAPVLPSEWARYPDPATEFEILRLTSPKFVSYLPPAYNRASSRRGSILLYSSARSGHSQIYSMDLKSGQSRQLTFGPDVAARGFSLLPDDRSVVYIQGNRVREVSLTRRRMRDVYESPAGTVLEPALGLAIDGSTALIVERAGDGRVLRAITLAASGSGAASELAACGDTVPHALPRPGRPGALYRCGTRWWIATQGVPPRELALSSGSTGPALWNADGSSFFYLSYAAEHKEPNSIREYFPETGEDRKVASTTQFVQFDRNSDSSVFVGASGSKASPYVLLSLRAVRRELTLCEHRCSDPAAVAPQFSPNSQRVFFQSDRHGKLAIYSMRVDRLVEATEP